MCVCVWGGFNTQHLSLALHSAQVNMDLQKQTPFTRSDRICHAGRPRSPETDFSIRFRIQPQIPPLAVNQRLTLLLQLFTEQAIISRLLVKSPNMASHKKGGHTSVGFISQVVLRDLFAISQRVALHFGEIPKPFSFILPHFVVVNFVTLRKVVTFLQVSRPCDTFL